MNLFVSPFYICSIYSIYRLLSTRLAIPLSPINPRAPSREGTTTNLVVSPTTNSQDPGLPWQGQPCRRHAQASTSKVNKNNGIQRQLCYLYIRTDVKLRCLLNSNNVSGYLSLLVIPKTTIRVTLCFCFVKENWIAGAILAGN